MVGAVPDCASLHPGYRPAPKQKIREQIQADLGRPVPFAKIYRFARTPNHLYIPRRLVPLRGAARDRHGRGAGCGGRGCALDERR